MYPGAFQAASAVASRCAGNQHVRATGSRFAAIPSGFLDNPRGPQHLVAGVLTGDTNEPALIVEPN